jgi:hypothetical protein
MSFSSLKSYVNEIIGDHSSDTEKENGIKMRQYIIYS